jgi:hypothetical protein
MKDCMNRTMLQPILNLYIAPGFLHFSYINLMIHVNTFQITFPPNSCNPPTTTWARQDQDYDGQRLLVETPLVGRSNFSRCRIPTTVGLGATGGMEGN